MKYFDPRCIKVGLWLTSFIGFLAVTFPLVAQTHEGGVQAGGGITTLYLTRKIGMGYNAGLWYSFGFNDRWSANLGASFHRFQTAFDASGQRSVNVGMVDNLNDLYDLHSRVISYHEVQEITMVQIPLMAMWKVPAFHLLGGHFYIAGGLKLGLPVSSKFSAKDFTVVNTAYYPAYNNTVSEPLFAGYGTFENRNSKDKLRLRPMFSAALEGGWLWFPQSMFRLYTGLYLDYGLTDLREGRPKPFVIPNPQNPTRFKTQSILHSSDSNGDAMVKRVSPISLGIVLRLTIGPTSIKSRTKPYTIWHRHQTRTYR